MSEPGLEVLFEKKMKNYTTMVGAPLQNYYYYYYYYFALFG
jgi:hypothetical protein